MRVPGILGLVLVMAGPAVAQQRVDEAHAATRDGTVKISSVAGSIRVMGWSRDTVAITGTLGLDAERLDFQIDGRATRIHVVPDRAVLDSATANARLALGSDLEIGVPRGSFVAVRTVSASIDISDVAGGVDLESESGDIRVTSGPRSGTLSVYAESAGGDIVIDAQTKIVRAKSVDGSVRVSRGRGFVEISTISGTAELSGRAFSQGEITSVSGDIRFEGDFARGALSFLFETHSGTIELRLPSSIAADFDISTVHGRVENEFGPASNTAFSTGRGGVRVKVKSFKGAVRILRQR